MELVKMTRKVLKPGNQTTYRRILPFLCLLPTAAVLLWSGSAPSARVDRTLVLTDVRLIKGEGGLPMEHAIVLAICIKSCSYCRGGWVVAGGQDQRPAFL